MRVLVIDDDPDTRLLCRLNLKGSGHEVLEAPDGRLGILLAVRERPDVVVIELVLPDQDGAQVIAHLRELHATRDLPLIVLTGWRTVRSQRVAWAAGADDYLAKPFHPDRIVAAVEEVARLSAAERTSRRQAARAHLSNGVGAPWEIERAG